MKKPKNRFRRLKRVPCGFCTREIVVKDEPNGKLIEKDGKPMCAVCRAVKLSKFRTEIESSRPAMESDLKQVNEQFDKEEQEIVIHTAALAQEEIDRRAQSKVEEKPKA